MCRSDYKYTNILAINVLGISSFINVKCANNGLVILYNEINVDNNYSKLLIENYQISFVANYYAFIKIKLYQYSYKVELEMYNVKFTSLNNTTFKLLQVMQHENALGNYILFNKCIFEKLNLQGTDMLFFESPPYERNHHIKFIDCIFRHNQLYRLIKAHDSVNLKIESCIFHYKQINMLMQLFGDFGLNSMIITNTSFLQLSHIT